MRSAPAHRDMGCSGIIWSDPDGNTSTDTQAQFTRTEMTQKPALSSGPHSFLAFPLRFCCCQIQFPVQHFENLLSLAQTCTCAMVFLWNILLKTSWHSIKPHSVFHPSAYFATVAKPGCLLRNSPRKSTFKDDTGGPTVFQKGPFTF